VLGSAEESLQALDRGAQVRKLPWLLVRPGQLESNLGPIEVPGPGRAINQPRVGLNERCSEHTAALLRKRVVTHHHRRAGEIFRYSAMGLGCLFVGLDQLARTRQILGLRQSVLSQVR
jgi:hypothetical protein